MQKKETFYEFNPTILEEIKKAQVEAEEGNLLSLEEAKAFLKRHLNERSISNENLT